MESSAIFSDCGRYRYFLSRRWEDGEDCVFVGLNPSTADGSKNDATVQKCIHFARSWGFAGISLVNLYARRCRYPQALLTSDDPVGPDNDSWLTRIIIGAPLAIAMWGNHGARIYNGGIRRDTLVRELRSEWRCFGQTKLGAPKHPCIFPKKHRFKPFCCEL